MKNVTKILTTVVLCAAVFASTQRTDALGGNAAFWPDDEANIAAFPANINNHGFVQVTGMGSAAGSVDMVFGSGDHNWSLGFSNDADTWFDLGWGNGSNMGINIAMKASDDGTDTSDGFMLSYGNSNVFGGNLGFHYTSGDDSGNDWDANGMTINYAKSGCDCWVFSNMVASLNLPDETDTDPNTPGDEQDMTLDLDFWGNMGDGAATVMFAMGVEYDALDAGIRNTANLGLEVDVTSNVTLRGGMVWGYDLSNDDDETGANNYAWSTGAGVNMGAFNADFTLGSGFWDNPLGWVSGEDDDAAWGACTVTYNF